MVPADGGEPRVLVAPETGVCGGLAWSPDGTTISYLFGDLATPNDVWTVRVADGATRRWTDSMLGGGVRGRLVAPEKVAYRTFDGLDINAYLYRPAWEPGRRYPGIVWVHGGPTSQFLDTVQPQVQYFVAQGYVVLLPNIRGSTGYGRPFEDLNDRDWGGGDLQDVIAGAEYLKTLPDVDPDQLAVTGTSYGGIMAMMAVAFAPGVFQAAIPCSGYGDFVHMLGEQELRHIKLLEYELGKLPEDEAIYRKCSAIYRVAEAHDPLLRAARRGALSRLVRVARLRAGAGGALQAVLVQELSGRDLLHRLDRQREAATPRHAGLLRPLPEGHPAQSARGSAPTDPAEWDRSALVTQLQLARQAAGNACISPAKDVAE